MTDTPDLHIVILDGGVVVGAPVAPPPLKQGLLKRLLQGGREIEAGGLGRLQYFAVDGDRCALLGGAHRRVIPIQ